MKHTNNDVGQSEDNYELSDSELELVSGGRKTPSPDKAPAATMICSGNRGMSTHTEIALEL